MKNVKVYYFATAIAVAATVISGCQKQDPGAIVKQRAVERWNLLVERHAVKAYEYLSPGYRETHELEQYVAFVASAPLKWQSAKVLDQQCDAELCTVHLTVTSAIPGQLAGITHDIEHEAPVTEHWVSSGGQWYFLPDAPAKLSSHGAVAGEATQAPQGSSSAPAAAAPAVAPVGQAAPTPPPAQNEGSK